MNATLKRPDDSAEMPSPDKLSDIEVISHKNKKISLTELIFILAMTIVFLLPFINKAFHIDDPLYLWSAKHIISNAMDFYGFSVNWEGVEKPMSSVMQNPPLNAYVISLCSRVTGWREPGLHICYLIPACATIAGTYMLASKFCNQPLIASLSALCSTAFLVSSTNVMCDVMLTSWIVWAIFWWVHGLDKDSSLYLCLSAMGIILAVMTKYFGITIVPLLFVYTVLKVRRGGFWIVFLTIPVATLLCYQWLTSALYGVGALTTASSYALNLKVGGDYWHKILKTVVFTGGCFLPALFLAPLLWSKRALILVSSIIVATAVILFVVIERWQFIPHLSTNLIIFQFVLMACTGLVVIVLCCSELAHKSSADTLLLSLWIVGTLVFAGFINWTISARNILPLIPPASILVARHLERRALQQIYLPYLLLIPSLLIALIVTWADFRLANSARTAANEISKTYNNMPEKLLFQGHWGFQYYLENLGGQALDFDKPQVRYGDIVVIPKNNSFIRALPKDRAVLMEKIKFDVSEYVTTMNGSVGAGFYSDGWGAMPFVCGKVPMEQYYVFKIK